MQVLEAVHKHSWHVGLLRPDSIVMAPEAYIVDFSYSAAFGSGEHPTAYQFKVVCLTL